MTPPNNFGGYFQNRIQQVVEKFREQDRMRAIALDQFNSTDPGQVTRFLTLMREFTSLERELLFLTTEALQSIADDRGLEPPLAIPADVFERDPFAATSSGSPSPVAPPDDRE